MVTRRELDSNRGSRSCKPSTFTTELSRYPISPAESFQEEADMLYLTTLHILFKLTF